MRLLAFLALLLTGAVTAGAPLAVAAGPEVAAVRPLPNLPGIQLLLLRLSLRMDRIDSEYRLMNATQRAQQLGAADLLLTQLKARYLNPHQQNTLFKTEMRLRTLKQELRGSP